MKSYRVWCAMLLMLLCSVVDPIMARATNLNISQREEVAGKRTVMRTILGSEMLRGVEFK